MQASGNKSYSNYALHWIKIDVESTLLILLAVVSRFLITVKLHHVHLTPLHLRGEVVEGWWWWWYKWGLYFK